MRRCTHFHKLVDKHRIALGVSESPFPAANLASKGLYCPQQSTFKRDWYVAYIVFMMNHVQCRSTFIPFLEGCRLRACTVEGVGSRIWVIGMFEHLSPFYKPEHPGAEVQRFESRFSEKHAFSSVNPS